jgi:hypothetical protein
LRRLGPVQAPAASRPRSLRIADSSLVTPFRKLSGADIADPLRQSFSRNLAHFRLGFSLGVCTGLQYQFKVWTGLTSISIRAETYQVIGFTYSPPMSRRKPQLSATANRQREGPRDAR